MPVPSSLASLSQTPGSNSPAGSDTVFPSLDDYLREIFADLARLRDGAQHILTSVSGTDTITASCAQISTFAAGQMFAFVSAGSNATTTVTLNINSLGAKSILRPGGGAMAVGDIPASGVVFVGYNGTNFEHLNSRHASTADSATSNAVDAAYFMALLTGNPLLQFDTNDYIWYDRTNNKMGFSVGGTDRLTIDATDGPQRTTDASTSNGLVRKAQMDAVSAGVGNLSGVISYSASATVPLSAAGKLVTVYGNTGNVTLTLPTPVGNDGKCIRIYNNSTYTVTLATPAGVFAGPGVAVMQALCQCMVVSDGANWIFIGGGWVGNNSQSWADVTGSRTTGTTYYNTTGVPMQVFVESGSGSTGVITVGGTTMEFVQGAGSPRASICVLVPPGVGYSVTNTFANWYELR